jgi:hypothetical protein
MFAHVVRKKLDNHLSGHPKNTKGLQRIEPFEPKGCRELNAFLQKPTL